MGEPKRVIPLTSFMAIGPLKSATRKDVFGSEYVYRGVLWVAMGFLYEQLALIGRRLTGDVTSAMQLICVEPENHQGMVDFQRTQVNDRLEAYRRIHGRQPDSLCNLLLETEYAHAEANLSAMHGLAADRLKRSGHPLRTISESKVRLREPATWQWIRMVGAEAICFGMLYPDLTRDIMSKLRRPDASNGDWKRFCAEMPSGRAGRKAESPYSLERQEADALEFLRLYVQEMRPELAGLLGRLEKRTRVQGKLTVTPRAAKELRAIQAANATDASHVLRIDTEADGFSLWLGPEQVGDAVLGSDETALLRASPRVVQKLETATVVVDCVDGDDGRPRLIVYPEGDSP